MIGVDIKMLERHRKTYEQLQKKLEELTNADIEDQ